MTEENTSIATFHIKSRTFGKFQFQMRIDNPTFEKMFQAVKIDIDLTYADGTALHLPIMPKLKDEDGNVYCELDDEGERLLQDYLGDRIR